MKRALLVIMLVLLADQALKVYMKTQFLLGASVPEWTPNGKAYLQLVENPGMAFGMKFGGETGKLLLTLFRIAAVIVIGYILKKMIATGREPWLIVSLALIFAGALGNIIDSAFYGLLFDKGTIYDPITGDDIGYRGLATFGSPGYASFLHGSVVDMFYFPLWQGRFPSWLPFWGDQPFVFFRPVFNIADAAISVGVAMMILMRRKTRTEPAPAAQAPLADAQVEDGALDPSAVRIEASRTNGDD